MTTREGSLEAPTRHPIDWKNPEYYDEPKIVAEMERIFDICHGCRRCVSLCNTFPKLFDYVDESAVGRGGRRAEGEVLGRGGPVLPLRPLLHGEVPVRSAASVERGLPAPHAARQGLPVPRGQDEAPGARPHALLDRPQRQARDDPGRGADGERRARSRSRCARWARRSLRVHKDAWVPRVRAASLPAQRRREQAAPGAGTASARPARSRSTRPAT